MSISRYQNGSWCKRFHSVAAATRAVVSQRWMFEESSLPPRIQAVEDRTVRYEPLRGRNLLPDELPKVAALLGQTDARLSRGKLRGRIAGECISTDAVRIDGFADPFRVNALKKTRAQGSLLSRSAAIGAVTRGCSFPAALYKDSNVRNFVVVGSRVRVVDFDVVTLAPPGYDLAKLVLSGALTWGVLDFHPLDLLSEYVEAACDELGAERRVDPDWFHVWLELHWMLTARYVAPTRYGFSWPDYRPRESRVRIRRALAG